MSFSPNNGSRVVLLPQDREIMALTGMDERQYRNFVRAALLHSEIRPGDPTAFLVIPFLIKLVIGVALSYLATLLAPKPKAPQQVSVENNNIQGQTVVNGARFTPKSGFDSVQNVVEIGSVIPLVYTNRQVIDGVAYGGVRVNTNLLWSQIYSIGGGQMLRALFLVGEGTIPELDPTQFAIGNNLINNYDLAVRDSGRISIYYSPDGGRITSADHIAGVIAANDLGNAENAGGADVFQVRGQDDDWESSFCFTSTPSNQTTFGLHSFIGNNFPYKVNPSFRPAVVLQPGDAGEVRCPNDWQAQAQRRKQDVLFSGRSGLIGNAQGLQSVEVGDELTYTLFTSTDQDRVFTEVNPNGADGEAGCGDVAQAVAGRQRGWDEALSIGDMYRIGSAVCICTDRTDAAFVSEADGNAGSQQINAMFEVVRAGQVATWTAGQIQEDGRRECAASRSPHLFRFAEGSFSTDRAGNVLEVGLRSSVQVDIRGLCNFRDAHSYRRCDNEACFDYNGQAAQNIQASIFQSGTYSSPETRYSFFRISYRIAGSNDEFTNIEQLFGVRSATGVALFNYIRFEFPDANRWELRFTPISSWEVRSNSATGNLEVLDPHANNIRRIQSGDVDIRYTGVSVLRTDGTFRISSLTTPDGQDLGPVFDDGAYYGDQWARAAEEFFYSEITASTRQPEHSIVYVNTIQENPTPPTYADMAVVGMNIRSSTEISRLQQFSVYVNQGINSTSRFPDVLFDLLTNPRYGTGQVLNPAQVDQESFEAAAIWTTTRRFFFDGAVSERVNIRGWGAQVASHFLLDLVVRNGRFALQPVATFNGPETVRGMYTAGNIIQDTFEMSYSDLQDRVPIRVSVKWRQERESTDITSRGLFPVVREVTVRETGVDEAAPIQQIDLSDYCTSQTHAIDRAKWELRTRRMITHSIKFKTTPTEASLDIGSVFKLGMETVNYNQPQNGAIGSDGTVTAWPPLADGSYDVLLWDGITNDLQEVTLEVIDSKAKQRNSVFCLRSSVTDAQTYKTQALSFDEEGNIEVEATYFPTDDNGVSLLTEGWNDATNWVIDGEL